MGLPLATSTWDESEIEAIHRVVNSDRYSMGPEVSNFESEFAEFVGSRYCVMVNSGSSANLLAVASLFYSGRIDLKPGDEVIVPAVSWSTTFFPLHQYGLKLIFVDVDKETLNLDLDSVTKAISDKTRLIFSVNLLGNPVDYNRLREIVNGREVSIIEDNCESMGASLDGKQAGTFGELGTFSSYFSHHISTMEGGMVVTDDEELYHLMLSLRSHGWTRHLPKENQIATKSDDDFSESFRFILPGYNLRPLEMSGAIGRSQLEKLPAIVQGRRRNANFFIERFGEIDGIMIQKEVGESSWFGFSIILDEGLDRGLLLSQLRENDVDYRPIVAGNFTKNPVIGLIEHEIRGSLDNANYIHDNGFFIGNHHFEIMDELESVARIIEHFINENS